MTCEFFFVVVKFTFIQNSYRKMFEMNEWLMENDKNDSKNVLCKRLLLLTNSDAPH